MVCLDDFMFVCFDFFCFVFLLVEGLGRRVIWFIVCRWFSSRLRSCCRSGRSCRLFRRSCSVSGIGWRKSRKRWCRMVYGFVGSLSVVIDN